MQASLRSTLARLSGLLLCALLAGSVPFFERDDADDGAVRTTRAGARALDAPTTADAYTFVVFGDRTGGPPEGIEILREAVRETNLLGPDLVMTVGDLINGYNQEPEWLEQMHEFRDSMNVLDAPWYPVAGNHDVYWRGTGAPPVGEHEGNYERHFGPLWYSFEHQGDGFVVLYTDEGNPETGERTFTKPECQRMGAEQFTWLAETLADLRPAKNVFLFLHHPRWLGDSYGDDWERVHDLLVAAGNVKAVFAGHIHHMRYDPQDGIEYFTLATVGGHQAGLAPQAGWLDQYHVVTVRGERLDVVAYPVGAALDPREITGERVDQVAAFARSLQPTFDGALRLGPDLSASGGFGLTLRNPAADAVRFQLSLAPGDPIWSFEPDGADVTLAAGEERRVTFAGTRAGGWPSEAFRLPEVDLSGELLGGSRPVTVPSIRFGVPVNASALFEEVEPARPAQLALDGRAAHLRVEANQLALPDGPFTLEAWFLADEFRSRQGLVCNTENSGYGLFVSGGVPEFLVHLGGTYVAAKTEAPVLATGTWQHLAGVFDGAELRLYVDGRRVAVNAAAGPRTVNSLPLFVGGDVDGRGALTSPFPGRLDEVRLSRVARYSEDFEPARGFQPDDATVLYLPMDEEVAGWTRDASTHAAHARLQGGAVLVRK